MPRRFTPAQLLSELTGMPQIECPDSETLSKWLDGLLPPDEAEFHERHLEECESCLGTIDRLKAILEG